MVDVITNYSGGLMLERILSVRRWLSLHNGAPTLGDPNEISGGDYIRRQIGFSTPSGKSTLSTNRITFSGLPASTIKYLGVWNGISDNQMLFVVTLPSPIQVDANQSLIFEPGDIAITI